MAREPNGTGKRQSGKGRPKVPAEHRRQHRIVDERSEMKERQSSKIKELAHTLAAEGFVSLDEQAEALGLSRSTTWTILKARHKNYGLSTAVINRVLGKPDLNSRVRAKFIEYIREKAAGAYGHNDAQLNRFARRLGGPSAAVTHGTVLTQLQARRQHPSDHAPESKQAAKVRDFWTAKD